MMDRRSAIKTAALAFGVPYVWRSTAHAAPSETVRHVSVGAGGMAGSDINSLTGSKNLKLVAVADVDSAKFKPWKDKYPDLKVYADWREMFEKEQFDSANISTPDHMHACPTMRAMRMGKAVYTQKPLCQTIHETRMLTAAAAETKVVTQMGIQIHSHAVHKSVVATIRAGAIGQVKEVHSWSSKTWGDDTAKPDRTDTPPENLNWDLWLGVAEERPFIGGGYYHPGFNSLGVKFPKAVTSVGGKPNETNWGLNAQVEYVFPGSEFTTDEVKVTWYDGTNRPPEDVRKGIQGKLSDQGSIYLGTKGVLYSPYIAAPVLIGADAKPAMEPGDNHYLQFVEAVRGNGKTSAPFSYAGPLTEMVLLGCLSTRFPKTAMQWDSAKMEFAGNPAATAFVRRTYRKGWEEKGLS
jgi:hypothetical protein